MTVPTKEQLDRYMDLVVGGEEAEDAIAVIWADEPAPTPPPAPKKPTVMVTEFWDGIVIGWETCSILNQGCGKHVSKCKCAGGPRSLKVFEKWHQQPETMPNYGASVARAAAEAPATPVVGAGDMPGRPSSDDMPAESMVPCVLGQHLAKIDEADKNDDGTYSCFTCQESGAQRGVKADG